MKLSHLRDILAVAETGSLRAASRHLGITQPAITRSIRDMEHEFGVSLFERHARGVRLTESGHAFVRRAQAVESELRRAREEIEQFKGASTGEVSLVVSTATSMSLMPRAIAEFRRRYPDAVLKISESFFAPIEREVLNGRIDFYVGPFDGTSAQALLVEQLFKNRRIVVGRHGHPMAAATTLAELGEARWIRQTQSTRSTEGDFEQMFADAGLPLPRIAIHARSAFISISTIVNSDLLTVLPQQWLDFPMTAALIAPLKIKSVEAAPMCIVRRRDMPLTPMAEYLCDLMRRAGTNYAHQLSPALEL